MNDRTVNLWDYIPPFLKELSEYKEIIDAENPSFQELADNAKNTFDNCFISTSLENGLKKYEAILGIVPNTSDTLEIRRNRIISLWNDEGSFTIKGLEQKVKIIVGNENISVYLDENTPYLLHIIVSDDDQKRIFEVKNFVNSIVPANLKVDIRSQIETEDDVYGVEFDLNSQKIVRLGACSDYSYGSDFDNATPWGGRYRCNLTDDGVEVAKYGDSEFSETGYLTSAVTVDGITYPVGTPVQVMVKQPKFYYCVIPIVTDDIEDGVGIQMSKVRCFISETQHDHFKVHPLFIDGSGNELDHVYLSAYEATYFDVSANAYVTNNSQSVDSDNDKLSSIASVQPVRDTGSNGTPRTFDMACFRKLAKNRGDGWYQALIKSFSATQLLFLIEYISLSAEASALIGFSTPVNEVQNTGTTSDLGNASGKVTITDVGALISYRGEENIIGNIDAFIDGILLNTPAGTHSMKTYVCDGFDFSDDFENYQKTNFEIYHDGIASAYIHTFCYDENYDWLFMPCKLLVTQGTILRTDRIVKTSKSVNTAFISLGGYLRNNIGFYRMMKSFYNNNTQYVAQGARLVYIPNSAN